MRDSVFFSCVSPFPLSLSHLILRRKSSTQMLTLSISAAALLMLSIASVTTTAEQQQQPSSSQLLQHRHSLFSTLPVEPIDDNFQVTRHQVKVVDLAGFREWEVKGSHQALIRAADPQVISTSCN